MSQDCPGGRVSHPATHREVVKLINSFTGEKTKCSGQICLEHKTSDQDWEVDGWEVVSITRSKL